MPIPRVSLRMRTDAGEREGELVATAGTTIEVELADLAAGIGVDYTETDTLKVRLEGRLRMRLLDKTAEIGGSFSRDMFTGEDEISGTLELEIDKDVAASLTTTISPTEKMVGGSLKITF